MASSGSDRVFPPVREEREKQTSKLGQSIRRFLARSGLERPFLEHQAQAAFVDAVRSRLGSAAAEAVEPEGVRQGELIVRVRGDALRQRLHFERAHLMDTLNTAAGQKVLTSIRFV